jgi:CRP/FNR family transcriptional regulator, cyclic AMP receptor protein
MIERFVGENNKWKLIEAVKRQLIVREDEALAVKLCDGNNLELLEVEAGTRIITQDGDEDDLFLILVGRVSVQAHGREVAVSKAGEHVGEMSVIDPCANRSASVVALERTVLAKISEPIFTTLAAQFPDLWRQLAVQLGSRVRQRNELLPQRNPRPVLFLGSSKEGLPVVREIQNAFQHDDFLVRPWATPGVFGASRYPLEALDQQLRSSDFAVLVLGPDDLVLSRGSISDAPRDNVVFELGFFMGALTRDRTFMVIPRGEGTKVPSDLFGLTALTYAPGGPDTLAERIGPLSNELRSMIIKAGPK